MLKHWKNSEKAAEKKRSEEKMKNLSVARCLLLIGVKQSHFMNFKLTHLCMMIEFDLSSSSSFCVASDFDWPALTIITVTIDYNVDVDEYRKTNQLWNLIWIKHGRMDMVCAWWWWRTGSIELLLWTIIILQKNKINWKIITFVGFWRLL